MQMKRLLAALAAALVLAACSSSKPSSNGATTSSSTSANSATSSAPTTEVAAATTTTLPAAPFAQVSGTYVAGVADGGNVFVRGDGASRFLQTDFVACPKCTTATGPLSSLDFALKTLAPLTSGGFTATGTVSETSDPTWAKQLTPNSAAGSPVTATFTADHHMTLSFLPANDVLNFVSKSAIYSQASPCTVAAVTPAVLADGNGANQKVNGVQCSVDGEWAEASVSITSGQSSIDSVAVLAGNGNTWVAVDRPTICNNHDVTPSFYQTACGTS